MGAALLTHCPATPVASFWAASTSHTLALLPLPLSRVTNHPSFCTESPMSQNMTSQDTHSPGFWQWVHTFEWKSVRPIQRPRRQGLGTLCFSVRLPSSSSHCGHISPDHGCPHSCLWFLMMDLACCVTAGSWVRLHLHLQMNYYALCWDGIGFIFHIVSIMTLFSKSSGNENENNDTTSSSMTHTSPPKRLNNGAAVMTGGRTHTHWIRETDSQRGTYHMVCRKEEKGMWRRRRESSVETESHESGMRQACPSKSSQSFLRPLKRRQCSVHNRGHTLARAYPPRNPSPCHSLDGSISWEGCN